MTARPRPGPAAEMGRERDPFKIDVRKLKNLGLTRSFEGRVRGLAPRARVSVADLAERGSGRSRRFEPVVAD